VTPSVEALKARLKFDTPFWAETCARIVNKDRELVPLVATPWQLEFDAALERQRDQGHPMRAIVLKARQLGFSTWTEAKILQRITQMEYQDAVVVAHEIKTAGAIFEMARTMHHNLPDEVELGLGFNIKPDVIGASFSPNGRKFMTFGERSRKLREQGRTGTSTLNIDTAGAPESGRGQTRNLVHLSEVAKWPENATSGTASKMISVLNSVPYRPETLVVLESTANGMNHFHKRWEAAVSGENDPMSGESYVPIFVPWWREPAYSMPFRTPEARAEFVAQIGAGPYGEKEELYQELYGASPEQLMWRRMMIRTQHEDKVELFEQENPASPEEAFIGSGNPVFSGILVARAIKAAAAEPEPVRGTLRASGFVTKKTRSGTIEVPTGVLWVPEDQMARDEPVLEVWEHPVTAEQQIDLPRSEQSADGAYVIGVDVAEGQANTFLTKPLIEANFGEALQENTHGLRHGRTARQLNTYVIDERGRHGAIEGEHDDLLMAAMIAHRVMDERRAPKEHKRKKYRYEAGDSVTGW
jgi:hypothetical protein